MTATNAALATVCACPPPFMKPLEERVRYDHTTHALDMPVDWVAPGNETFWKQVWVSPEFQQLVGTAGWLNDEVIPLLSRLPIGFFDPPANSRFYFSAWLMNSVMRRTYDNPLIQDLYVLHEALHAATLNNYYNPRLPDSASHALRVNEVEVSLETECWVYLRHPQWVGKTFDPLWVMQPSLMNVERSALPGPLEALYEQLRSTTRWPLSREHSDWKDHHLWRVRRRMTEEAVTSADKLVQKYERMSVKWIDKIAPVSALVFDARLQLQRNAKYSWIEAVNEWSRFGAQHVHQCLPFDHPDLSLSRRSA